MERPRHAPLLGVCCLAAVLTVAVVQALELDWFLDDANFQYTAAYAEGLLVAYGLAVIAIAGAAAALPERGRRLLVAAAGLGLVATLVVTLPLSGELWSFIWALLTMATCWRLGAWALEAIGAPRLAGAAPAAWLAGVGLLGLYLLFAGRWALLSFWTAGLPVLVLGLLGVAGLARALGRGGAERVFAEAFSTRWAAAAAALCLLTAALASIWAAAPELQYDALYFKEWLPSEWARTGEIDVDLLRLHPFINVWGFGQLIAVPGQVAGAEGVGRYLQWLAHGAAMATVWWAARRSAWAPLAAAALAVTPLLFWQATTAYDDAILTFAGLSLAVAVLISLREPQEPALVTGIALGALAGVCLDFKAHLAPLALGLALGWLVMRRGPRLSALAGLVAGGAVAAAPLLAMRWIDLGNPILPGYNDVFESPYWPSRETGGLGVPQAGGDGSLGPLGTFWDTIVDTGPVGAYGLLSAAVAIALVLGWRRSPEGRGVTALWMGVVVAAVGWYLLFRGDRYLLPLAAVAVLTLALLAGAGRPRAWVEGVGLAALAVAALALWPATVSQFFTVPGRGIPLRAALGQVDDLEYERSSTADRDLLARFDEHAPPGALAVAFAPQRSWLTEGRDLAPFWELHARLGIDGSHPRAPAETLREVREAGVTWVVGGESQGLEQFPYLKRMVKAYGEPVATSGTRTLYRLPQAPG